MRNYWYSTPNCKWRHFKFTFIFFFTVFTEYLIRLFRIISIPFYYFHPPDHMILMAIQALDFRCQCTQHKLQSICAVLTFDPQLSKNLNIFCKRQISIKLSYLYQRYEYRDNYFFKIKFVFFLYLLLSVS